MKNLNFIHGRVLSLKRQGIAGVRVRLFNLQKQIIGESITNKSGHYSIWLEVPKKNVPFLRQRFHTGQIKVFDGAEKQIGQSSRIRLSRQTALNIPIEQRLTVKSVAKPLSLSGELFSHAGFYNQISEAVSMIVNPKLPAHNAMLQMAACPLPPLFREPLIMDNVWRTLSNDRKAVILLKSQIFSVLDKTAQKEGAFAQIQENFKILNKSIGIKMPPALNTAKDLYYRMQEIVPNWEKNINKLSVWHWPEPEKQDSKNKFDFRDEGFGPGIFEENIVPLYISLIQSAETREEASLLLLGVKAGLHNIDKARDLYSAASGVLQGGSNNPMLMMLSQHGGMCGPDDGPMRPPLIDKPEIPGFIFIPKFTDEELRILECFFQGFPITPIIPDTPSLRPHIDNLAPTNACPNQQVTINGSGFHPQCRVRFSKGNGAFVNALILSRSQTNLVVRMPHNAVAGPVDVVNPGPGFMRCGYFVPTFIYSNKKDIEGGLTIIHSFNLLKNGRAIAYAEPGEEVQIHWNVSPINGNVRVIIRNWENHAVHTLNNQSAVGSFNLSIPNPLVPDETNIDRNYTISLVVNGSCGSQTEELLLPISVKPKLKIEAVEVTQGIQNFSINSDGPNDVDLISRKGTIVRVFVSSNRSGFNNDQVNLTGKITIGNQRLYPINGATNTRVVTSGVNPSSITARPKSQLRREITDHSLNFFIPGSQAHGNKTLFIKVWSTLNNVWEVTAERSKAFSWIPEKKLKVRWFRVRMTKHGNISLTQQEASYNFNRAMDLLTSSDADVTAAPISNYVSSLDLTKSSHNRRFMRRIRRTRRNLRRNHGLEKSALFAGVIAQASGFGLGRANRPGHNSWSQVHLSSDGENSSRRVTTAHELAHNLGFKHVKLPTSGDNVPSSTESHPNGGYIDNVAFDIFYNKVIKEGCSGNNCVGDFMSYYRPRRTSIRQWNRLLNRI
jgi:hypothetical protein